MTIEITPDTEREEVERRIGRTVDREDVRESEARRNRLQRNAQRQSRTWDTVLELDPDHDTAHVESQTDGGPKIVISAREFDQPVTSLPGRHWDWLAQRSLGIHEVGHIRYSDMDGHDDWMDDIGAGATGVAHGLWNAAEDGAIEKQIANRWPNYYEPLRTLRANLFEDNQPGIADPEHGGHVYPVAHAAQGAVLDLWTREVYDLNIGTLDALLNPQDDSLHFACQQDEDLFRDEVLPECEMLVEEALGTPNAEERNRLMFERIETIIDLLDDAKADGKAQKNGDGALNDDGGSGMPDDSRGNHSGAAQSDAEELSGEVDVQPSDGEESSQDDAGSLADPEDIDVSDELSKQVAEQVADDERDEAGVNEDFLEELGEMADSLESNTENLKSGKIEVPTHNWDYSDSRADAAKVASKRLEQILRQRLQSERRTETQRHRRRGRLDSQNLSKTAVGSTRVKMQKNEPEEKDYHCVVVLDRSGSMAGRKMEGAESASGMLLHALEAVGVDTMLLELYGSELRLAKPFGVPTDQRKEYVYHGETAGGTPLAEAVELARGRLNRESGNRFMFVVTDGGTSNKSRFRETISSCTFPVLGVALNGKAAGAGAYHRHVEADASDDLSQTLENLLHEVMF